MTKPFKSRQSIASFSFWRSLIGMMGFSVCFAALIASLIHISIGSFLSRVIRSIAKPIIFAPPLAKKPSTLSNNEGFCLNLLYSSRKLSTCLLSRDNFSVFFSPLTVWVTVTELVPAYWKSKLVTLLTISVGKPLLLTFMEVWSFPEIITWSTEFP